MAKILCVDDERDIAELVKLVLELGQHQVTVVTEPENAVSTALELAPDRVSRAYARRVVIPSDCGVAAAVEESRLTPTAPRPPRASPSSGR